MPTFFRSLVASVALLTAGCSLLPAPQPASPTPVSAPAAPPADPPAPPSPPAAGPAEPPRAAVPPATGRPPAPPALPPAPSDPAILVGLSQEQANAMLGPPSSIRQETPATVWAYRIGDCQLDLFFYEDVRTRKQQSLAYELQTREKTDQAQRACFNRIWTAKNGRP